MKERYFFGRVLTRRVDFFAFPRTGSHLFRYCTAGLFDLVAFGQPNVDNPEAVARQRELNPLALAILDLREDGVPHAPVHFNGLAAGQHGAPEVGVSPVVILSRKRMPALYSLYRAQRDRWKTPIGDVAAWFRAKSERYSAFYAAAEEILRSHPDRALLIKYEDLIAGPEPLEALVEFVGVKPKLSPWLVHNVTRFESFTRPGERTFYRAGDNDAWREDREWVEALRRAEAPELVS